MRAALVLLVTTENSLVGMVVFLLVWIMLNCLWLALVRRPIVAALISLEILITLTLLSRFKFDKLWMTIDFVDVMIVDRDTTAFLLAIFPALRWWIVLAGAATLSRSSSPGGWIDFGSGYADEPRRVLGIGCSAARRFAALADRA